MEQECSIPCSLKPATYLYPKPDQSAPSQPILRSILILSTHLRLRLPCGLSHSRFCTKILYAPLLSPIRVTWPVHLILLDLITRIILGEQYKSWRSSVCNFLQSQLCRPSQAQTSSSTVTCRRQSSTHVPLLMCLVKFHIHIKWQTQLKFCNFYVFWTQNGRQKFTWAWKFQYPTNINV